MSFLCRIRARGFRRTNWRRSSMNTVRWRALTGSTRGPGWAVDHEAICRVIGRVDQCSERDGQRVHVYGAGAGGVWGGIGFKSLSLCPSFGQAAEFDTQRPFFIFRTFGVGIVLALVLRQQHPVVSYPIVIFATAFSFSSIPRPGASFSTIWPSFGITLSP